MILPFSINELMYGTKKRKRRAPMQLTNTTDYASRIVCYLAIKKRRVTMAKLASELKAPESYIPKIIKQLKNWEELKTLVKYIIKVFLYLILAVMTLIRWLIKIPMMLGNILLYFLSIIFILTGVLSYGFALESARECGRMIIIGMAFGAIPDFVPFWGKSLETLVAKLLSMTNE